MAFFRYFVTPLFFFVFVVWFSSLLSSSSSSWPVDVALQELRANGTEISADVARFAELVRQVNERPGFMRATAQRATTHLTLMNVLLFGGGLLVLFSLTLFFGVCAGMGAGGLLFASALYQAAFLAAALHFWTNYEGRFRTAGGVLATISTSLTPVWTYALQILFGIWDTPPGELSGFHRTVNSKWIPMELSTCVYALVLSYGIPESFLMLPVGFCLWYASMDLTPLLFRFSDYSFDKRAWVSYFSGMGMLLLAWGVEVYIVDSFWILFFACVAMLGSAFISYSERRHEPGVLFALTSVAMLMGGVYFDQRVLLYFGFLKLIAVLCAETYATSMTRAPSAFFTVVRLAMALLAFSVSESMQSPLIFTVAVCVWLLFIATLVKHTLADQGELMQLTVWGASYLLGQLGPFSPLLCVLVSGLGTSSGLFLSGYLKKDSMFLRAFRLTLSFVVLFVGYFSHNPPYLLSAVSGGLGVLWFFGVQTADLSVQQVTFLRLWSNAPLVYALLFFAIQSAEVPFYLFALAILAAHTSIAHDRYRGILFDIYGLLLCFVAVVLDARLILAIGALILVAKVTRLASRFSNSLLFPFVLTIVGCGIIGCGFFVQIYGPELRAYVLAHFQLPQGYEAVTSAVRDTVSRRLDGLRATFLSFAHDSDTTKIYALAYVALVALVLLHWMYRTLIAYPRVDPEAAPACTVRSFVARAAADTEGHGLEFVITGSKPTDLAFHAAELHVVGDEFWLKAEQTYGSVVSLGKATLYPLKLCDFRMPAADFAAGSDSFTTVVSIGTGRKGDRRVSHATIEKALQSMENAAFRLQIHYFRRDRAPYSGVLLSVPTTAGGLLAQSKKNR